MLLCYAVLCYDYAGWVDYDALSMNAQVLSYLAAVVVTIVVVIVVVVNVVSVVLFALFACIWRGAVHVPSPG